MERAKDQTDIAFRVPEVAKKLNISVSTVKRKIVSKDIDSFSLGKSIRIPATFFNIEPTGEDQLLSGPGIAEALHISPAFAFKLLRSNTFPTISWGKSKRVFRSELQKWIDENTRGKQDV